MSQQKLDPTLKASWVADLRSGKFQQARETLQAPDGTMCFCCLGVLDYTNQKTRWSDMLNRLSGGSLEAGTYGLSDDLQAFLAINNDGVNKASILSELMLNLGYETHPEWDLKCPSPFDSSVLVPAASFNSIADWIEKNL